MLAMVCLAIMFFLFDGIGINGIAINDNTLADLKSQYPDHDILVVHMIQTTGSSWRLYILRLGKASGEVVLDFIFDTWYLKLNDEIDFFRITS
jgi:hypothetical protein